MVKVLWNQLFAIPERGGQWLRNVQNSEEIQDFPGNNFLTHSESRYRRMTIKPIQKA
ncbi:MAG: hypothetical protein JWR05_770 [Mucilaginibacter sp.]|nr:hypothetical protein [Mucilaginibacter sp.]